MQHRVLCHFTTPNGKVNSELPSLYEFEPYSKHLLAKMIRKLSELLHPRGFFDALWPYRNISILFSHCNSASKMWRRIYGASMISVYLTVSYFTSYELYKSFIEQHGYHAQFFLVYFAFWSQPIIIMIHTLTWAFVGHACYKKVISYSTLVDQELVRVCSKHVNLKMMVMRQLVCLTLSVLLPVAQAVLHILSRSDAITWGNVIRIGIIHYPDTVTNVVGSLFGNLVYLTGDRYALINSALEGIGKLNRNDAALTIRQLRIVHQKLLFVSRNITEAFAVQTVACVFSALVHSVYNLFSVYKIQASSRGGSDIDNTFHSAIGIVGDLAIVVYVAYCCDRTVKEASVMKLIVWILSRAEADNL